MKTGESWKTLAGSFDTLSSIEARCDVAELHAAVVEGVAWWTLALTFDAHSTIHTGQDVTHIQFTSVSHKTFKTVTFPVGKASASVVTVVTYFTHTSVAE